MKKSLATLVIGLLVLLAALPVWAQGGDEYERDPVAEQKILDRLAALNPDAVPIFQQATTALDSGDNETARAGYLSVLDLVPGFPDALRRLSYIEIDTGNADLAIDYATQAHTADPSPFNKMAMAQALVMSDNPVQQQLAINYARDAAEALPDDLGAQTTYLYTALSAQDQAAIQAASQSVLKLDSGNVLGHYGAFWAAMSVNDWDTAHREAELLQDMDYASLGVTEKDIRTLPIKAELGRGSATRDPQVVADAAAELIQLAPDDPMGYYFAGLAAADLRQWDTARHNLSLARDLGWPAAEIDDVLAQVNPKANEADNQSKATSLAVKFGYIVAGWAVLMVVLLIVGILLSRITLATVKTARFTKGQRIGPAERLMRLLYRGVIALASLYYYLSIPILSLIVIGLTGGLLYLFIEAGRIPIKLVLMLIVGAGAVLYSLVNSLFVRTPNLEPGRPIKPDEAPALWKLTRDVADRLQTRPVQAIYLTPGTEVGVTEQGNMIAKLTDRSERRLIVGLGALPALTQGQFQAILAHEYGHFANRDTAGGGMAHHVRLSMRQMAINLIQNAQARPYNPAWQFLRLYDRIFMRITLGASRLHEIQADRFAAMTYGIQNFADGLTNLTRQMIVFDYQVNQEANSALREKRDFTNLWLLPPLDGQMRGKMEQDLAQVMNRPTSAYDSHPAPALDLLPNREQLQAEMTVRVERNVKEQARRMRAYGR
jgi:Zn-dependent protease with chaperone function